MNINMLSDLDLRSSTHLTTAASSCIVISTGGYGRSRQWSALFNIIDSIIKLDDHFMSSIPSSDQISSTSSVTSKRHACRHCPSVQSDKEGKR